MADGACVSDFFNTPYVQVHIAIFSDKLKRAQQYYAQRQNSDDDDDSNDLEYQANCASWTMICHPLQVQLWCWLGGLYTNTFSSYC